MLIFWAIHKMYPPSDHIHITIVKGNRKAKQNKNNVFYLGFGQLVNSIHTMGFLNHS